MLPPSARILATRFGAARTTAIVARPATPFLFPRRCASTAPTVSKSRSWKSLAARLGIAGAILYYCNTTEVFAEERTERVRVLPAADSEVEPETLPTLDALAQERRQRKATTTAASSPRAPEQAQQAAVPQEGAEELEEEAGQQGAFNPETGEINWDCPCLGGMAHGPCGEEFKTAFSCFVFSTEEPKGMDCVDKFKSMQNCFREHPDIYGTELEGDAEDEEDEDALLEEDVARSNASASAAPQDPAPTTSSKAVANAGTDGSRRTGSSSSTIAAAPSRADPTEAHAINKADGGHVPASYRTAGDAPASSDRTERSRTSSGQVESTDGQVSESEELVPKAAHDARN